MSDTLRSESIVLCEGYQDRAFWNGLLLFVGCVTPNQATNIADGQQESNRNEFIVRDPMGKRVIGGQFGYHSVNGHFIRVIPCRGKNRVPVELRSLLGQRKIEPVLRRLIVNVDSDVDAANGADKTTGLRVQDVLRIVQGFDIEARLENNEIVIDQDVSRISLARWEVADASGKGIPNQQTLERLVCAAIVAAYPPRGTHVQNWLDARPAAPSFSVKEFAWSHMAGWYAEHGCDDFYRCLWDDAAVAAELKTRLEASGAWQIAETLANET